MVTKYDFSGWATRNDIKCSDGRVIRKDAFKEQDGITVPLVWNHNHTDADNVLGHALLENRDQGVYAFCTFNDTEQGKNARTLVEHKDVCSLSIFANKLKQNGSDVVHGYIREVSLVLAGANPGAYIDNIISHNDEEDSQATIYNDSEILELNHSEELEEPTIVEETSNEETSPNEGETPTEENTSEDKQEVAHSDETSETKDETEGNEINHAEESLDDETIGDVFNTLTDKQKTVVYALIGQAIADTSEKENANTEDEKAMKHNAFENQENVSVEETKTLSHSDFEEIMKDARNHGSVKESFLAHGITNVEALFPEVQLVTKTPKVVDVENDWVSVVMNGVHHTPFSRIKSTYATLTADEARAKGYIKGKQKVEEVIAAAKRTTTPTTVYKLQKMDRDDVLDITDFDVIAFLKTEMRGKLEQELARAFLFGDGRSSSSDDKINEQNIRPIVSDNAVYTLSHGVAGSDAASIAAAMIDEVVVGMEDYQGAGNPTLFVRKDIFTRMLLLKDTNQHRLYNGAKDLANAMMVNRVVAVPASVMGNTYGLAVDLSDYNVGADKGGAVTMFDDFDINYNKQEYLIETRCSGALVTPYSAVVFKAAE